MMSYPKMASLVKEYLDDEGYTAAEGVNRRFPGGSVLELSQEHYLAVILPYTEPSVGMISALAYLQDMGLDYWGITDTILLGKGQSTIMALHLQPIAAELD